MIRTQIYLPHEQLVLLRQKAVEQNTSVSEVIRQMVENCGQKKKTRKNAGAILLAMARDAERRKIKGPKDLASNLDKYLYG